MENQYTADDLNKYLNDEQSRAIDQYLSSLDAIEYLELNLHNEQSGMRQKLIHHSALHICSAIEFEKQKGKDIKMLYPKPLIDLHEYYMQILPDAILLKVNCYLLCGDGNVDAGFVIESLEKLKNKDLY